MIYKKHKNGAYNIHTIKTDRFRNIQIEVIFRNNIDRNRVAKRTVLFDTLLESNEFYKTKREIYLKNEELYNSTLFSVTYKLGNQILTSVAMDMLNPKYAEKNYLEEALSFYFSIIFNPNVTNGEFEEGPLNTVKTKVISDIKCIKENPTRFSMLQALNAMDPNSVSTINVCGTTEEVEAITPTNLYEEYKYILKHDYVDIYVIGDFDEDEMIDLINRYTKFDTIKTHDLNLYVSNNIRKKVKKITEDGIYDQSQIVTILNTVNLTPEERKYTFQIYNMILGGGSLETKLYRNLRDEHSLCYSVRSSYQKYDDLLVIITSVDKANSEFAVKLIKKSVEEMLNKVTDEEVNNAILRKISSINMAFDSAGNIIDDYLFRDITDLDDVETRIENYKKITKEDVMNVAKKVMFNTIYVLESGDEHEN